jgi:hypothetical protein
VLSVVCGEGGDVACCDEALMCIAAVAKAGRGW